MDNTQTDKTADVDADEVTLTILNSNPEIKKFGVLVSAKLFSDSPYAIEQLARQQAAKEEE
jgi:hypothetical protein